MRALILLLPLAVAIAGDASPLEEAAKRWASDSAEERDAASRVVAAHIRRELAPLVAALQSPDPEVRRRARAAVESLLPPRPPEPPVREEQPLAGQVFILNGGAVQGRLRANANWARLVVVQHAAEPEELRAMGISGAPASDPVLREQLGLAEGRGFAVSAVEPRGVAERLGIRASDILLSIDGRPVMEAADVAKALGARAARITLVRRGRLATLGAREEEGGAGAREGR